MTAYRSLVLDIYPRRAHFDYFRAMAYPYVGLTAQVDITDFLTCVKGEHLPLFLSLCYCVDQAANQVPQFRQRISEDGIIQFEHCLTSHTVALEDGSYCYCTLDGSNPRITWGRYHTAEGRTLLPLSLLCNHALVDGVHIARFYAALEEQLSLVRREILSRQ